MLDSLQGVYATLLASSKATSIYTLPSLTLMKNSASELFLLPGKQEAEMSYQLTFGYVRMLAILLRKGVKEGSKVSLLGFPTARMQELKCAHLLIGRLQSCLQLAVYSCCRLLESGPVCCSGS